ncbi:programmed cell death protein 2 [Choanephora cucurbitarum]|nr:programmed cell death protein 2 [Choanephora cucurbitarum]
MVNKKQSKKEVPVFLGLPDGEIEVDNDAYVTKLGGLPLWLEPSKPPSSQLCHCKVCRKPMYLIFQSYAPLPDSPYHRVLYVWGCNRRACMRKEGSFSVLRSHVVDQAYLKAQRQKEEEKRKREEKKKAAAAKNQQAFGNGFQLGDLWGSSTSFGSGTGGFGTGSSGFGTGGSGFGMTKPTAASIVAKSNKLQEKEADKLVDQLTQLTITDPVDISVLPYFPGQYLYIDEEPTDRYESMGVDLSKYKQYIDMEQELLMELDEGGNGETWQGEAYEKQSLPRGVDKQFKKFTERVELSPSQCVRYDMNGQPLFYSALTAQQQQKINTVCPHCRGPRVFECQLMPNVLSILPTAEYATQEQPVTVSETKAKDTKSLLDSWNVGMEFGTIMVFVCEKDCHPGSIEDVTYMEETAIVQYEMD